MNYYGLATGSLSSPFLRLDYLAQAGPRLVRLIRAGTTTNLLAEMPHIQWDTPYGKYHLWGGHRLWHAPEVFPRSSLPDDAGLQVEALPSGVRLIGAPESPTGMRKIVEVVMSPERPSLFIQHILVNEGLWPVEVAPWAITALPVGGIAVIPHQAPKSNGRQPDRHIALWPGTLWEDCRFRFYNEALLVEGRPGQPPGKIGLRTYQGWMAYARDDSLLIKYFDASLPGAYPDRDCNAEVYVEASYIELETLAPLRILEPGQSAIHRETWVVHPWSSYTTNLRETIKRICQIAEEDDFSV